VLIKLDPGPLFETKESLSSSTPGGPVQLGALVSVPVPAPPELAIRASVKRSKRTDQSGVISY